MVYSSTIVMNHLCWYYVFNTSNSIQLNRCGQPLWSTIVVNHCDQPFWSSLIKHCDAALCSSIIVINHCLWATVVTIATNHCLSATVSQSTIVINHCGQPFGQPVSPNRCDQLLSLKHCGQPLSQPLPLNHCDQPLWAKPQEFSRAPLTPFRTALPFWGQIAWN